jgi:serine/threonine-protein kinase
LAELVMKCLAKKPADRWQTADELLPQLEALATPSGGATPTRTTPVTAPGSGWQVWVALAGAVVSVVAVMLAVLLSGGEPEGPPRLVVLPFENLGAEEDQYFAEGITDEITARLSALRGLAVIARQSAVQYRNTTKSPQQIADELDVDFILEATVSWEHRADAVSTVRLRPQLIRASTAENVWAGVLDESLTEIFATQTRIADHVVGALGVALGGSERETLERVPTNNLGAYDFYLRAEDHSQRNMVEGEARRAVEMYETAVELDEDFTDAWAGLAATLVFLYWQHGDVDALPQAHAALERARQLGPDLTRTRIASGRLYYYGDRNFDRALEELISVYEREPNNASLNRLIGVLLRRMGRWDEAIEYSRRAIELSPAASQLYQQVAITMTYTRYYPEAARLLNRAITLDPHNGPCYNQLAGLYLKWDGHLDEAERTVQQMSNQFDQASVDSSEQSATYQRTNQEQDIYSFGALGYLSIARVFAAEWSDRLGARPQALWVQAEVARQLNQTEIARVYYDSAMTLYSTPRFYERTLARYHAVMAIMYAGLADSSNAMEHGRRAVELLPARSDALEGPAIQQFFSEVCIKVGDHNTAIDQLESLLSIPSQLSVALLRVDPLYDPLRDNPRFQALLERYAN